MSFGVQSTQPAVLADLGRRHGIMAHREVSEAVTAAGFSTWNMDLIVGSRAESLATCATRSMISCRSSTRRRTSAATRSRPNPRPRSGAIPPRHPDEDETADAYDLVGEVLDEHGYLWEEISNWAKPGHECRHNHVYWDHEDYAGFGSAAHSHDHGRRYWNVRTPDRYVELIRRGESPTRWRGVRRRGESTLRTRVTRAAHLARRATRGVRLARGDQAPRAGRSRSRHAHAKGPTRRKPGDRPPKERGVSQ